MAVLLFCGSIYKIISLQTTLATVIDPELSTRTGPSMESPTLSSLEEGALVVVLKSHSDRLQIQMGTELPGWVPSDKVITAKATF